MQLQTVSNQPTMSSREIAGYVGTTHDSVLKTVRLLVERGVVFGNETPYTHPQNQQTYTEFLLDYRNTMVVVSGYSAEVRARIIDRWQELEATQGPDLSTEEGKLLLIQQMTVKQLALLHQTKQQALQLAQAAPKVVYADAMTNAEGSVLVRDAAKTIGVPVRKLEKALREKRVILTDNAPAAKYVSQGYFVESLNHYETNTRGRQISRTTRVTGLGLEFLRRFVVRHAGLFERKAAA